METPALVEVLFAVMLALVVLFDLYWLARDSDRPRRDSLAAPRRERRRRAADSELP
jgi:hypothetical protein